MGRILIGILIIAVLIISGCAQSREAEQSIDRESKIPADAVKMTPETDVTPPKSLSSEYYDPIPLPYPINTAGAEDSAFMIPDGNTLYFFFTPDVRVPPEKQLLDSVTGIYVSHKQGDSWEKPERVILQDPGKLALDGCFFVLENKAWFCSAREGYTDINWFTAEFKNGKWSDWKGAGFRTEYKVGELHIFQDELYYHSDKEGGKGGLDIWVSKKVNNKWQEPINLELVNSERGEGWPALSPDGNELWISRDYGLWRSKKVDGKWSSPELMISPLAGEASVDDEGNIYFTHHFYKNSTMIEADIYIAKKKNPS